MVPFDDKSPFVTSGIRFGTAAISTRGLVEDDMERVVDLIDRAIKNHLDEEALQSIGKDVNELMSHRPLYVA